MLAVWGRLLAVVLLAVIGVYAVLLERPPDPAPASAPPADFSADRAVSVVDQLAREPRPIGSPASDAARDALVGRLRAEGLAPRVDATASLAAEEGQARAARVENVVATLPGTDPTGAVVLMAHYDSVAAGPGAADDMSGVATILETVRALRAGPPLRNDVTVVLTDGEEAGLHGARAWVREQLAPRSPHRRPQLGGPGRRGPVVAVPDLAGQRRARRRVGAVGAVSARRLVAGGDLPLPAQRHRPLARARRGPAGHERGVHRGRVPVPHPRRRAREPQPGLGAEPRRQRPRADAGPGGAGPRAAGPRRLRRARHR